MADPYYIGEAANILGTASRRFDWNKAADYLERISSGALVRRVGWIADHVKADVPPEAQEDQQGPLDAQTPPSAALRRPFGQRRIAQLEQAQEQARHEWRG
ncbi:MAG: hypothetical protein HYU53_16805 [Acidobacteria bacterium]|nr:hypothetical protein [Acidobacteriota bacterium]